MFLKLEYQISAGQLSADSSSTETHLVKKRPPHAGSIASREQFKPIRIGENLVMNCKSKS